MLYRLNNGTIITDKNIYKESENIRDLIKVNDLIELDGGFKRQVNNSDFIKGRFNPDIKIKALYVFDNYGTYKMVAQDKGRGLKLCM